MRASGIALLNEYRRNQEREIERLKEQVYQTREKWITACLQRDSARYQQGKLGSIIARQRLALRKLRAELELRRTPEEKLIKAATKTWRRERAEREAEVQNG